MFGGAAAAGEPLFAVEVTTLQGKKRLLTGSAFRCPAADGGCSHMPAWSQSLYCTITHRVVSVGKARTG